MLYVLPGAGIVDSEYSGGGVEVKLPLDITTCWVRIGGWYDQTGQ